MTRNMIVLFVLITLFVFYPGYHNESMAKQTEKKVWAKYWVRPDLSAYDILYINNVTITNKQVNYLHDIPSRPTNISQAETVAARMIDYIENKTLPYLFEDIRRGDGNGVEKAVIMRVELTKYYDPGISRKRSGGKGIWIDFIARFIDACSGQELAAIDTSTTRGWQRYMKTYKHHDDLETNPRYLELEVARTLGMYLALSKRRDVQDYDKKLLEQQASMANERCDAAKWAAIYITRGCIPYESKRISFSLMIDETYLGVCPTPLVNRQLIRLALPSKYYFKVMVRPGKHIIWLNRGGRDGNRKHFKHLEIDAEAGESYYVNTKAKNIVAGSPCLLNLLTPSKGKDKMASKELTLIKILY